MKKPQVSLSRSRTRLSRSASGNSSRKEGLGISLILIAGGTLLLVCLFFLQSRLGGFGARRQALQVDVEDDDGDIIGLNLGENEQLERAKVVAKGPPGREVDEELLEARKYEELEDEDVDDVATTTDESKSSGNEEEDGQQDDEKELEEAEDEQGENEGVDGFLGEDDAEESSSEQKQSSEQEKSSEKKQSSEQDSSSEEKQNLTTTKRLERLGQIQTLPRTSEFAEKDVKFELRKLPNSGFIARKFGMRKQIGGQGSVQAGTDDFGSDDEPTESSVRKRLSEVTDMEDVLMVRRDRLVNSKASGSSTSTKGVVANRRVYDTEFATKVQKPQFEPWNPTGSSLLQDPDSIGPGVLTKNDKLISKALRKASEEFSVEAANANADVAGNAHVAGAGRKELLRWPDNGTAIAEAAASGTGTAVVTETREGLKKGRRSDGRKWGAFPGIDSRLTFSDFMEEFLKADCELNVFMAWNSPSWSFTVRHQRGLESLLQFHPRACVVVFSETVEWDFMQRFVKKGYRVAVVRPNLEEFLMNTPAEEFASVWFTWRRIDLFYLHYSELLRLAALWRYGGVYLDSDIVVLRPLNGLRSTIGEEVLADSTTRLNGAAMAFDKGSSFIWDCLEEYTATYNDTLVEWNGADLLQRVVAAKPYASSQLVVLPPMSFYPVASSNITSYMSSHDEALMQQMLAESYTFHLWNRETYALVPDSQSLVGKLLARHCIWCQDLL